MDFNKIREFYNSLQDGESRFIFMQKVNYLFSGKRSYLREMADCANRLFHPAKLVRNINCLLEDNRKRKAGVVLYGAGFDSVKCLDKCNKSKLDVLAFCDSSYTKNDEISAEESRHLGLPLISRKELLNDERYKDCSIVISTEIYQEEICDMLISSGVSHERLFIFDGAYGCTNYLYQDSYFGPEFMHPTGNEVYIDAGCFDGATIKQFIEWCGGKYDKIIGLEPHPVQYDKTVMNLEKWGIRSTDIYKKGAWSSATELSFALSIHSVRNDASAARIIDTGDVRIHTVPIDSIVGDEKVTFIKMDIEGAELEALKGARNTILRDKPRLAVCLYHKPEDILEIPQYLFELMPSYRFFIRHHNFLRSGVSPAACVSETVLYAV